MSEEKPLMEGFDVALILVVVTLLGLGVYQLWQIVEGVIFS